MLHTPNKVKHFIWRACNNSLPTLDNLFYRQIVSFVCCNICNAHPEDILHVVWGCTKVANMWKELNWAHLSVSPYLREFTNLFSSFLQVREDYRVEIFSIAAWMLWTRRNSIRLGRLARPLIQIFPEAGKLLRDFLEAHDEDLALVSIPVPIQAKWPILMQLCLSTTTQLVRDLSFVTSTGRSLVLYRCVFHCLFSCYN